MIECFIVVHRNHAEGMDAYGFLNEDAAKKSVNDDVDTVVKSLMEAGHKPTVLRYAPYSVGVYAAGGNIYYEWNIIISNVL